MQMNLKKTPAFAPIYSVQFPTLSGGLNLRDLGYLLDSDESPYMKNLVWRNGLLQSRAGQRKVAQADHRSGTAAWPASENPCYAACEDPFHGYAFFHVGQSIQCLPVEAPLTETFDEEEPLYCTVISGSHRIKPGRGTFFRYQKSLYYKNDGGFYVIDYDERGYGAKTVPSRFNAAETGTAFDVYSNYNPTTGAVSVGDQFSLVSADADWLELNGYRVLLRDRATGYLLTAQDSPTLQVAEGQQSVEITSAAEQVIFTLGVVQLERADSLDPDTTRREVGVLLTCVPPLNVSGPQDPLGVLRMNGTSADLELGAYDLAANSDYLTQAREAVWVLSPQTGAAHLTVTAANLGAGDRFGVPYYAVYATGFTTAAAPFLCRDVAALADTEENAPVIVINASPVNGSGTMYQPENRLSSKKTVWYNAVAGETVYHLPVTNVSHIHPVVVDGVVKSPGTDYTVDLEAGTVTFTTAPDPGSPQVNNTVRITYSKPNPEALQALLRCKYAAVVSGGEAAQYIVLGGNDTQPDAIFWNGNDELAIQPWYFPMISYNLVGTAGDPVTGFGRQYNDTLVFSEHTVGKLSYSIETVDGRAVPSFGYARVNSRIGCDLPWTIQQVENNVVFCNSYAGAHVVLSSSAAYENNIQPLSEKINTDGSASGRGIPGLLQDIRDSGDVIGFDDDERYWLCAAGKVYAWDYSVSTYAKPSWFYWTGISPAGLFRDYQHNRYHMNAAGDVTAFLPVLSDYGTEGIEKVYQFPTLHFGSYDRLKSVESLLLSVRSDTASEVSIRYDTELETREDLTPLAVLPESSVIRGSRSTVAVARRSPKCRHIRQFGLTLYNANPGEELALVSAEVFYRFAGKER